MNGWFSEVLDSKRNGTHVVFICGFLDNVEATPDDVDCSAITLKCSGNHQSDS